MKLWGEMTTTEKFDALQREMVQISNALNALASDLDVTWYGMTQTRTELTKITKDVATLKALWPTKYSQTSNQAAAVETKRRNGGVEMQAPTSSPPA